MADRFAADEDLWAASKRDFVADSRDDLADARDDSADSRDAAADERDRRADEREAALLAWERRLDLRAAHQGVPADDTEDERAELRGERGEAARWRETRQSEREVRRIDRESASALRQEAANRRLVTAPTTALAMVFAEIAAYLYESDDLDEVLTRIAEVAVSTVAGCHSASVTIREDDRFRTVASTHTEATGVDQAQYEVREGPSLAAIDDVVVYAPGFPDDRWPALGARPVDYGVRSVISYRLGSADPVPDAGLAGSLNSYADAPDAFELHAREMGLVLAAHASVAARAVQKRTGLEQIERHLREALMSRDVIGQAKGILMERLHLTPDDAFDALRRASQELNVKVRVIAGRLAETGAIADGSARS
jgi:hypothetical protein